MSASKAILIIGGSGFVGTHIALRLRDNYKVYATYNRHQLQISGVGYFPLEFANENWVKRLIYTIKPNAVIFAAGPENVDWAQANQREADHVHARGAAVIAKTAELFAPRFIYLSNCYTFDGLHGNYRENDTLLPATTLGKAKVNGENYVRGKCLNYLIIRSSPLYGRGNAHNPSFLDRIRMKLDLGERIELDHEALHSFAPVDSLTMVVERAINTGVKNRAIHIGGLTKMTAYEFAREFARKFGYDPSLILPKRTVLKTEAMVQNMSYVWDYSLNSSQAVELLKFQPFLVEEGLDLIEKKTIAVT